MKRLVACHMSGLWRICLTARLPERKERAKFLSFIFHKVV